MEHTFNLIKKDLDHNNCYTLRGQIMHIKNVTILAPLKQHIKALKIFNKLMNIW